MKKKRQIRNILSMCSQTDLSKNHMTNDKKSTCNLVASMEFKSIALDVSIVSQNSKVWEKLIENQMIMTRAKRTTKKTQKEKWLKI